MSPAGRPARCVLCGAPGRFHEDPGYVLCDADWRDIEAARAAFGSAALDCPECGGELVRAHWYDWLARALWCPACGVYLDPDTGQVV